MNWSPVPRAFFDHFLEFVFGWKVLRFAFRRASLRPTCDQFELFGSQCLIVAEIAETLYRAPGRHPALQNFFFNGSPPRERFAIFRQRERGSAFWREGEKARVEDGGNLPFTSNRSCDDVMGRD